MREERTSTGFAGEAPNSDDVGARAGAIGAPKLANGFGSDSTGFATSFSAGGEVTGVFPPKAKGVMAGEMIGGVGTERAAPKKEGIFVVAGAASMAFVVGAIGSTGFEKKLAEAEAEAEMARATLAGGADLGREGIGATVEGGADDIRERRLVDSTAGDADFDESVLAVGKLKVEGKTIGGSLIFPRSPSSTGGRSSSRAEKTRDDVM